MKTDSIQLSPLIIQEIGLPPNDGPEVLNQVMEVLSILSKNDALTIFLMAAKGIKSELDTPTKIGLTKKQYYTRLKQLVDLGLLVKHGNSYIQTAFGKLVYKKHLMGLLNNVKNSKYLEMIDTLKGNSRFTDTDIMEFISKIGPQASFIDEQEKKSPVIISAFDKMITKVLEIIEFAESEIILVSRFTNELIINTMIKKSNAGVQVKVLADISMVDSFFDKAGPKTKINDKNKKERISVVADPYYPTPISRRYVKTPYCVLIVDKKHVGIELVDNHDPNKFKNALFVTDSQLASQMETFFTDLWEKANPNPPQIANQ
ncbi:MAG: hypothetical protein ABI340_08770 [Nitrososphaera sp.]